MKKNTPIKIKISKKIFAPVYLERGFLEDKSRNLVLYGGAGSGKSFAATDKIIFRMLKEKPHKFLVIRKVANTLKDSVYDLFVQRIEQFGLSKLFKITKSPMEITCMNGNKIIFKGLDNPEKIKSVAGITGVWIEEASELSQEDFNQLQLRVRGKRIKHYVQFLITFNPITDTHWLKKHFFDRDQPDTTIIHTTYKDNPFLDESYIQTLENLKNVDKVYYEIYALGKWGSLGNLVYKNYKIVEDISTDPEDYDWVYNGMDFGLTYSSFTAETLFRKLGEPVLAGCGSYELLSVKI